MNSNCHFRNTNISCISVALVAICIYPLTNSLFFQQTKYIHLESMVCARHRVCIGFLLTTTDYPSLTNNYVKGSKFLCFNFFVLFSLCERLVVRDKKLSLTLFIYIMWPSRCYRDTILVDFHLSILQLMFHLAFST